MRFYLALIFSCTLIFNSCKKDKDSDPVPNDIVHDIYIGGGDNGGPVYWKNGVQVALPYDTSGSAGSYVSCMFVDGNDVYAAGRHVMQAAFWKNGTLQLLPVVGSYYSYATGITVLNGDVYISGYDNSDPAGGTNSHAVYWKNDIRFELTDSSDSYTRDIQISGSDIYVVGGDFDLGAVCWKNGVPTSLSVQNSNAFAICYNGSDQYIVGGSEGDPVYWKNGIKYDIINSPQYFNALDIFADGNDLYIGGIDNYIPVLWKNGIVSYLPIDSNLTQGYASGISRLNNDVYVVGHERDGFSPTISRALYWKNGDRYVLPSVSNSSAGCIFIN